MLGQGKRVLLQRLGDGTGADQADRNATRYNRAVFDHLNAFQIFAVDSLGNTSRLATVTAEVLGFSAFSLLVATTGLEIAVKFCERSPLDPLVLFQSAHDCSRFPACGWD